MNQIISKTISVKDLTDTELVDEYNSVCNSLDAEYKILAGMKTVKKEILDEILKRFGGNK